MRKSSKRTLSLLLAVLMVTALFTVAPLSASAANVNQGTIALGETKTVTISNGDIALWSFTPAQDVTIWFYSASDKDTYGYLYDAQMDCLAENDDGGNGNQFKITYSLTGGSTYYFGAKFCYTDTTGDIRVTLTPPPLWEHDGARITAYNGNDAEIVVPDQLDGDNITTLGSSLFYNNNTVTKVTVPEGITEIESDAFSNCSSLTTVKLPDTLTEIGYSAFYGDNSLMTLEIPANVNSIKNYALNFTNCRVMTFKTNLTSGAVPTYGGIITDGETIFQCYEGSFIDNYLKNKRVDSSRIKYIDDTATCTVSYDNYKEPAKNITNMPVSGTANPDYTINQTIPTSDDLIFLGWDTSTNSNTVVYYPGETYTFTENITLYGVWGYALNFYANKELLYKKYITDFSNISGSDIPVPAPVAAKFFDGYYYGDTKCFSYNQWFTYNNNLTSEAAVKGEIKLDAKWVEAAAVAGTTVSLDDVIRLNIYVDKKDSDDTLRFSIKNKDHDYNLEGDDRMQGLSQNDDFTVTDEGNYLKVAVKVYAKEMADQFEIDCYNETKSQRAFDFITSAKNYLETLAANPDKYAPAEKADDLRNICYATLNYGAAAQKQFNHYDSVPLANENVPASYQAVEVPANLAYDEGSQADFSEFGLSYYASSLGLYDYTSYAVCFEVTGDSTPNVYDSNGEKLYPYEVGKAIYNKDESGYEEYDMIAYNIPDIPAKDILNDFTLKFELTVDGEKKTKEYTFSPKTYIAKVLNKTGVDPDYSYGTTYNYEQYNSKERQSEIQLVDTVKAIYDYSKRAKSYFG